ncbi:CoA-binding protein [Paucidesulfovibrio longus]|uniref:CoA-binding protein n=1 Tax=Paucidesulfovibrio longus TaxID=889 RepID=UPI0003B612E6|nr:CoA-binding protein [Paucidesulfovibrio longus]
MLHDTKELTALLGQVKSIAVVGAVDKPGRPVDMVGRYLIEAGFDVIPVHPKRTGVWGLTTYPALSAIPVPVDLVDLFRAPEHCPAHAEETLAMNPRPRCFWMQSGIASPAARSILADSGILVVEDLCLKVFHQQHIRGGL